MNTKDLLLSEIDQTPERLLAEILDFVQFLKSRALGPALETARASEAVLAKDWLRPEEEEAWKDL